MEDVYRLIQGPDRLTLNKEGKKIEIFQSLGGGLLDKYGPLDGELRYIHYFFIHIRYMCRWVLTLKCCLVYSIFSSLSIIHCSIFLHRLGYSMLKCFIYIYIDQVLQDLIVHVYQIFMFYPWSVWCMPENYHWQKWWLSITMVVMLFQHCILSLTTGKSLYCVLISCIGMLSQHAPRCELLVASLQSDWVYSRKNIYQKGTSALNDLIKDSYSRQRLCPIVYTRVTYLWHCRCSPRYGVPKGQTGRWGTLLEHNT